MTDIFVYGVLLYKDIREALLGKDYPTTEATLPGYTRKAVKDLPYPGLAEAPGEAVDGFVLEGVSIPDTTVLDKFEEEYERRLVEVHTDDGTRIVHTYAPKEGALELTEQYWDPDEFVYVEFYKETVIPEFYDNLK